MRDARLPAVAKRKLNARGAWPRPRREEKQYTVSMQTNKVNERRKKAANYIDKHRRLVYTFGVARRAISEERNSIERRAFAPALFALPPHFHLPSSKRRAGKVCLACHGRNVFRIKISNVSTSIKANSSLDLFSCFIKLPSNGINLFASFSLVRYLLGLIFVVLIYRKRRRKRRSGRYFSIS